MSGALLMMLAAGEPFKLNLSGGSVPDEVFAPSTAFAAVVVRADGTVDAVSSGGTSQLSADTDWIVPNQFAPDGSTPASAMNFSVRATLLSGSTPSGTLDTWLPLTEDRSWSLTQSSSGSQSCSLKLEIATGADHTVRATGTYGLSATVF